MNNLLTLKNTNAVNTYDLEVLELDDNVAAILVDDWMVVEVKIVGDIEVVDESFAHEFGIERGWSFENNLKVSVVGAYDVETEEPLNTKLVDVTMLQAIEERIFDDLCEIKNDEMFG